MQRVRRVGQIVIWCTAAAALVYCLGSLHLFASGLDQVARDLKLDTAPEASLVYDRHGHIVFSFASEDRTNVPLDRVSSSLVSAVLTAEDRSFFRHAGMDVIGLTRAAWVDLKARAVKQGGSTITQQLIRNVALTTDRNLHRKIKEALLALRVERRFDKRQILEAYLNRIYLGNGHYGVEAAARGYFAKSALDLSTAESALLAGIIPCPSLCSPRSSPNVATARRNTVLKTMRDNSAISPREYADAVAAPLALAPERHDPYAATPHTNASHGDDMAGLHFLEAVRRQVMQQFGAEDVLKGGLRIYTTIDLRLQRIAEEAISARLEQLDRSGTLEAALVAIDPHNGYVLALVGGRDFHSSPFNRATQAKRQPGSAFKPLVFAAALEQGYTPSSPVSGMDTPIQTAQGDWLPSGEHENGDYTLRQALTVSSNRAAARVMQLVGVTTTQTYAKRLGISSPLPAVPSLALGTGEVTLMDLTSAYSAFANGGVIAPYTLITRIEDRHGTIIWQSSLDRQPYRALRPGTAFLISSMMADALNRGTGARARTEGFRLPAAGKTGTTDDYGDAWFVGYTPKLVAGVWFGYDEKKRIMNRGFAGTVAVPAWARFMKRATERDTPDWFRMPSDVERIKVCRKTGGRAAIACRTDVFEDYYLIGTGPYETCSDPHMDDPGVTIAPGVPANSLDQPTTALSAVF